MTVSQMLARVDSRELSEHMIVDNMEWWRKRIAQKNQDQSKLIMDSLFGKAIRKGAVEWQERMK